MRFPSSPTLRSIRQAIHGCLCLCLGLALFTPSATAQERRPQPLRLNGLVPSGVRNSATTSWGTYYFDLTNFTDTDRNARVLVFFSGKPDEQFGRDVWVPAHSTLKTWMLVGPARLQPDGRCEIETLLYDRTDGKEQLILPDTEERVRGRGEFFLKREPSTAIMLEEETDPEFTPGQLPQPDTPAYEAINLVRISRHARNLPVQIPIVKHGSLPPTAETFDGIDELVLASGRIAHDPAGMQALRYWLERGGRLWVMLDLVDPEPLAPILGDALDFQLVDRVGLTSTKIDSQPNVTPPGLASDTHEQPVQMARVLLPAQERLRQTINGWPTWFTRTVGRGKILFTTLGPRAWIRPRTARDPKPYDAFPWLEAPRESLTVISAELQTPPETTSIRDEDLRPILSEEIGYSVVSRETVAMIFGVGLLAALALGVVLRRTRRPELLGWLGPLAAVGAMLVFLFLGHKSRHAVPPTVAVVQVVDVVPGADDVPVHGLMAVYHPDSGPAEASAAHGGLFELDTAGLEGQTRRLVLTDLDSWHWENLSLPAGLRFAPFQYTVPTEKPIAAIAHCGPDGLEGQLNTAPFLDATDGLLTTASGRNLAIRLRPDGKFSAGSQDILPTGQYLSGAVLTDLQQRRQQLYRSTLKPRTDSVRGEGRNTIMVWTKPVDMHFTLASGARSTGSALLIMPLQLQRPAPDERVTIPGPLVVCRQVLRSGSLPGRPDSQIKLIPLHPSFQDKADMELRFQIPPEVLPVKVERARLVGKINAPGRRVTVSGRAEDKLVKLFNVENPLDPIDIDIAEDRFLALDADGGLHVEVDVSDPIGGEKEGRGEKWSIEYLELEIFARGVQ
jgi:hypothetical protein